ncbi:MAG: hypothetical protein EOP83_16985 [Verrucomicrobiaceae bacterium]|nr:MAG: hypothetical protein EOP83_16985 [Verrucomicrobiaceae bacterium]
MKLLHYTGVDKLDEQIFGQFLAVKFSHSFDWGHQLPSTLRDEVLEWIRLSMAGRAYFRYDPMSLYGYICLENPNDAFSFRMRFSPEVRWVEPDRETVAIGEEAVRKYGLANL